MKRPSIVLAFVVPTTLLLLLALGAGTLLVVAAGSSEERIEVSGEVTGVRAGRSYAYVIQRGGTLALVDAGSDTTGAALLVELARRGRQASEVSAVLLTHGHADHVGAASRFSAATVYVGEGDSDLVRGDRGPRGVLPRLLARIGRRAPAPQRLRTVLPGELVRVGDLEVEVVAVPGHTPGSVMYRLGDLLFTGDSLRPSGDAVDAAPWVFSEDAADNRRALERLVPQRFIAIADGHHGFTPDGRARFERWLARR